MKRTKLIAGNHKMHTGLPEGMQLAKECYQLLKNYTEQVDIVLFPPFTHLFAVSGILKNTGMFTGAQNCATESSGAFTGEVSAAMCVSAGANYVLIGHSERRHIFGEDETVLLKKINQALEAGLNIIYCFGEQLEQRENGYYFAFIQTQLETLQHVPETKLNQLILAYEPVWAIGTGKTASPEQAQEIHAYARQWFGNQFSAEAAAQIRILYGGSVKAENAAELLSQPDIDGALVGGASLDSHTFSAIVQAAI